MITPTPARHMHWEIADWCNYRCSYCWELRFLPSRAEVRYLPPSLADRALEFLSRLPEPWIVRLSAGEPSTHPQLLGLTAGVIRAGHRIAMETNLSLPLERYEAFARTAGPGLAYLAASLHLEHADPEEFLAKCLAVREILRGSGGSAEVQPGCVATPANLPALGRILPLFAAQDIPLRLMRMVDPNSWQLVDYERAQGSALEAHIPRKPASPLGQACAAGSRWLLMDIRGRLWRCHTARSFGLAGQERRGAYLGDLGSGTASLLKQAMDCPYGKCHCPGRPIQPEASLSACDNRA